MKFLYCVCLIFCLIINLVSSASVCAPGAVVTQSNLAAVTTQIANHNVAGDCQTVISNCVFDLSQFSSHPAGFTVISPCCGLATVCDAIVNSFHKKNLPLVLDFLQNPQSNFNAVMINTPAVTPSVNPPVTGTTTTSTNNPTNTVIPTSTTPVVTNPIPPSSVPAPVVAASASSSSSVITPQATANTNSISTTSPTLAFTGVTGYIILSLVLSTLLGFFGGVSGMLLYQRSVQARKA